MQQCRGSLVQGGPKESPGPSLDCSAPIVKTPLPLCHDSGVQPKEMNKQTAKERKGDGPSLYKREREMGKTKRVKTS